VLHRSSPDDALDLESVPAGRRLLDAAEEQGISPGSWEFWVWINRTKTPLPLKEPERRAALFLRVRKEFSGCPFGTN
jgi:hypothetical protein